MIKRHLSHVFENKTSPSLYLIPETQKPSGWLDGGNINQLNFSEAMANSYITC